MSPLGIVKVKPIFIAQVFRVPSITCIWVSLLANLIPSGIFVFFSVMFLQKFFIENTSTSPAWEQEPNKNDFKCNDDCNEEYIAISIGNSHC